MSRNGSEAKRALWRERLAKFARSGQTVTAFCEAEGVSQPTFYQWKRRLAGESSGRGPGKAKASARVQDAPRFVPVRIDGSRSAVGGGAASGWEGAAAVEIALPNGARVRVPVGDLGAVAAAIAAAGRVGRGNDAEVV